MLTATTQGNALWTRTIHHMNGLSAGSTVAVLHGRGVLAGMRDSVSFMELYAKHGGNAGYLHAALRTLATLGWVQRDGATGDTTRFTLTCRGRLALKYAPAFSHTTEALAVAEEIVDILFGARAGGERQAADSERLSRLADLFTREWDLPPAVGDADAAMRSEIRVMLDGTLVAPLAVALHDAGLLVAQAQQALRLPDIAGNREALALALDVLALQGWFKRAGTELELTEDGRAAALLCRQYFYPVRYIPTLRQADTLLFGNPATVPAYADGGDEDTARRKHIRFSGEVFSKTVSTPFFEVFLPIFQDPSPPRYIIDVGCGDATMLKALYETVRALPGSPSDLHAVAVEYKKVALTVADETLRRAAIPHTTLYGDINDPAALVRSLAEHGIDVAEAIFVTKSVIHTRPYLAPQNAPAFPATSGAVFVAADGSLIPASEMEQSLRELFSRWRQVLGRHGWVVCDAHTVDCAISAEHVGQSMQPTLDATHNISHQYLVEMPVFRAAAAQAGFTSVAHRALGAHAFGHDYMSIDHFVASR